MPQTH